MHIANVNFRVFLVNLNNLGEMILQEFCAALHIFNLDPDEVKGKAIDLLNDRKMEMTRQLFYGIVLNSKTTNFIRDFVEGL